MYNSFVGKNEFSFIAKLVVLYYAISPFLYLLRTLSGDVGITSFILRFFEPFLLVSTLFSCFLQNRFKLNAYILTFFLLGFYGVIIAIVQDNRLVDIVAGYSHFMTGILLFIYFYSSGKNLNIDRFMMVLSYATLSCCLAVLGFMYCMPYILGFHIYLGLACQVLIMVFFYNLHKRRFFQCILSVLLIILSGKRGVLVALLIGYILSLIFLLHRAKLKNIVKLLFAFVLISSIVVLVLPVTSEQLIKKYTYNEQATVDDYSAGRWNEVTSAYEGWVNNVENVILGSGFGFTYTYIHFLTKLADTEDYKNVHFSYLNPIIIFGVPVATLYYICLGLLFIRLFRRVDPSISYLKWSSLTYLIYACFVFNLFDEPIFWMINGVLFSYSDSVKRNVSLRANCESY